MNKTFTTGIWYSATCWIKFKSLNIALDLRLHQEYSFVSLGCSKLNEAIKGIPKTGITEIFGESGTGKTQIGLQLLLNRDYDEGI